MDRIDPNDMRILVAAIIAGATVRGSATPINPEWCLKQADALLDTVQDQPRSASCM